MIKKYKNTAKVLLISLFICLPFMTTTTHAATPDYGCPGGPVGPGTGANCPFTQNEVNQFCSEPSKLKSGDSVHCPNGKGGTEKIDNTSSPVNGTGGSNPKSDPSTECVTVDYANCGIIRYLTDFVNILTALVGIVVVIMIVVGGIQYSAARDNPQAVQAARTKIINAMLALAAYIFTSAFLQWIVPGGLF